MKNLQYEIRIPQKIYRRVTIHYCAWYDFLRNRRYNVRVESYGFWGHSREKRLGTRKVGVPNANKTFI